MDNKSRQLDSVSSQLKRAEKSVEDYENKVMPLSAPSFATPQKRESFRPSQSSLLNSTTKSVGSCSSADGDESDLSSLRLKLADAERRLEEKDREVKDMEVKLFESKVGFLTVKNHFRRSCLTVSDPSGCQVALL